MVLQKNPPKIKTQKTSWKFGYIFLKMITIVSLRINSVSMIKKSSLLLLFWIYFERAYDSYGMQQCFSASSLLHIHCVVTFGNSLACSDAWLMGMKNQLGTTNLWRRQHSPALQVPYGKIWALSFIFLQQLLQFKNYFIFLTECFYELGTAKLWQWQHSPAARAPSGKYGPYNLYF